jgi:uncharacterized protein (TIGR01777 family)
MIIAVTGASGLIGTALVANLESAGHDIRILVRRPLNDGDREIYWQPATGEIDAQELDGVDIVVHLAGKSIACRWTANAKEEIRRSRVDSTRLLATSLAKLQYRPQALVSASAVGYYGVRGDEVLTEDSTAGTDFLAEVCQEWENACRPAWEAGIRVVQLRTGMVLSPRGGALAKMLTPFKFGLGGVIGPGDQYMSWITLDDEVRAIKFLIEEPSVHGAVNLVAPQPVTNGQFTKDLGRVLGRPTILPMPSFAARLAFGEMADALLLGSTRVKPQRLEAAGFQFRDPSLEPALQKLLA